MEPRTVRLKGAPVPHTPGPRAYRRKATAHAAGLSGGAPEAWRLMRRWQSGIPLPLALSASLFALATSAGADGGGAAL
eukprot:COSAG04_NODE_22786_length_349_cov_0.624000_1_plen_77_part_01